MKNRKLLSAVALLLVLGVSVITGCSKKGDKGDTGATGAAGTPGATGPAGPDSVLYSAWIPIEMTATDNTNTEFVQQFDAPAITQAILDNGIVMGYLGYEDPTYGTTVANASLFFLEIFNVGTIIIDSQNDFSGNGNEYRYVVIPGSMSVSSTNGKTIKGYTVNQLKAMSYSNVAKLLGLPSTGSGAVKVSAN